MTRQELQAALKELRNNGATLNVKLTASQSALSAEYRRLVPSPVEPSLEEKKAAIKAKRDALKLNAKTELLHEAHRQLVVEQRDLSDSQLPSATNDSVETCVVEKELPSDEDFSMVNMTVIRRKAKELGIGFPSDSDKELYARVTEYTRHASDTHEQKLRYVNTQLVFLPYGSVSSTTQTPSVIHYYPSQALHRAASQGLKLVFKNINGTLVHRKGLKTSTYYTFYQYKVQCQKLIGDVSFDDYQNDVWLDGDSEWLQCPLPQAPKPIKRETETPAPKKHTTKSFDETSREAVQKDVEKSAYLGDLCGGSKRGVDKKASAQDKKDAARAKRENLAKLQLNQAPRHQAKKQEPKKHTAIQESVKKVALTISKTVNPYFVTYESKLTDTEKQAVKNAKELASNVLSFCKGFAAASAARAA